MILTDVKSQYICLYSTFCSVNCLHMSVCLLLYWGQTLLHGNNEWKEGHKWIWQLVVIMEYEATSVWKQVPVTLHHFSPVFTSPSLHPHPHPHTQAMLDGYCIIILHPEVREDFPGMPQPFHFALHLLMQWQTGPDFLYPIHFTHCSLRWRLRNFKMK